MNRREPLMLHEIFIPDTLGALNQRVSMAPSSNGIGRWPPT